MLLSARKQPKTAIFKEKALHFPVKQIIVSYSTIVHCEIKWFIVRLSAEIQPLHADKQGFTWKNKTLRRIRVFSMRNTVVRSFNRLKYGVFRRKIMIFYSLKICFWGNKRPSSQKQQQNMQKQS